MLELLVFLICSAIVVSAILAICVKGVLAAAVSVSLATLFAAVSYVLLGAPDVAMTEASIGSGLSMLIFLYAIRRTAGAKD